MRKNLARGLVPFLCISILCTAIGCASATGSTPGSGESTVPQDSDSSPTPGDADEKEVLTTHYTIDFNSSEEISDTLYGLFLEDINYAVDGGLYAELIKNRSFEYGTAAANEGMHGWLNSDSDYLTFEIHDGSMDDTCLNENNPHYAIITNNGLSSATPFYGIGNVGYLDGLAVKGGEEYRVSLYMKGNSGYDGEVRLSLRNSDGLVYAETSFTDITDDWVKYETTLTPSSDCNDNLRFFVEIGMGSLCLDMVSLMPADTYKELPVRKDIGEFLEALNPSFLRFPGGCVIEGRDEASIYRWKDSVGDGLEFTVNGSITVGDVAARPQGKDIWQGTKQDPYYTTYGIGFYEYFELCEALNCIPVPVLNAGMTCQVQSPQYIVYALNSEELAQYIQDALDLVEFCRGDADTYWGAIRIAMGHETPFPLKYIAIGNEQWQTEYHAHYRKFVAAFENAAKENPALYGDIELIVANGTASGSREGWNFVEDFPDSITSMVDEHYYESPDWFMSNTARYDAYDRANQVKVFLGEYAAKANTLEAALAEAAYMTGLERNGDIVQMACYAPLFGNTKTNQWKPDMIFFSSNSLYGTVNYYVQKMFANNACTHILSCRKAEEISTEGIYTSVGTDENDDIIIKLVNTSDAPVETTFDFENININAYNNTAEITLLTGERLYDTNSFKEPTLLTPSGSSVDIGQSFIYTAPKYSVSIIRISTE